MSKFLRFIVNLFIVVAVLIAVAILVPPLAGVNTTIVDSASMDTNLPLGSITYSRSVPRSGISAGDEVLRESSGSVYAYVIEEVGENGEYTAVSAADENAAAQSITLDDPVLRVAVMVPYIGYVVMALQSTEGILILVLIAVLVIVLFILSELWKPDNAGADEKEENETAEEQPAVPQMVSDDSTGIDTDVIRAAMNENNDELARAQAEDDAAASGRGRTPRPGEDSAYAGEPAGNGEENRYAEAPAGAGEKSAYTEEPASSGQEPEHADQKLSAAGAENASAGETAAETDESPDSKEETRKKSWKERRAEKKARKKAAREKKAARDDSAGNDTAADAENAAPEELSEGRPQPAEAAGSAAEDIPQAPAGVENAGEEDNNHAAAAGHAEGGNTNASASVTASGQPAGTSTDAAAVPDGSGDAGRTDSQAAAQPADPNHFIPVNRPTLSEILDEARKAGDKPKVREDEATGITTVDYTDVL